MNKSSKTTPLSFASMTIVDLMATTFSALLLLWIVTLLRGVETHVPKDLIIAKPKPVDAKSYRITSQVLVETTQDDDNPNVENIQEPLGQISIYDEYIEFGFSISSRPRYKESRDEIRAQNSLFRKFLAELKPQLRGRNIQLLHVENGNIYTVIDILAEFDIGYVIQSAEPIKGEVDDENQHGNPEIDKNQQLDSDNMATETSSQKDSEDHTTDANTRRKPEVDGEATPQDNKSIPNPIITPPLDNRGRDLVLQGGDKSPPPWVTPALSSDNSFIQLNNTSVITNLLGNSMVFTQGISTELNLDVLTRQADVLLQSNPLVEITDPNTMETRSIPLDQTLGAVYLRQFVETSNIEYLRRWLFQKVYAEKGYDVNYDVYRDSLVFSETDIKQQLVTSISYLSIPAVQILLSFIVELAIIITLYAIFKHSKHVTSL